MAPPPKNTGRIISQEAFDDLVRENMEDLGMDPTEALEDAIESLKLQGVDLSGLVTCVPGQGSVNDHPVIQSLEKLKEFDSNEKSVGLEGLAKVLGKMSYLCRDCGAESSGNAAIAVRNGGVELVTSICAKISECGNGRVVISCLKALTALINDLQSAQTFQKSGGPDTIMRILRSNDADVDILNCCFSVVSTAATGNEILKESFMNLKIEEHIIDVLRRQKAGSIPSLYDAIRILLTSDDNRVVASQVYGYARKFGEIGVAEALVDTLHEGLSSPGLVSACIALKAVAVNDEICRSVADKGGIDAILQCIDNSGELGNKIVAKTCCSLLSKLAGSDANKSTVVEKQGIERLITLSSKFSHEPSVLQEVMSLISGLCLRSPDHAAHAVKVGAGDVAMQAMDMYPSVQLLQRNACFMIRNLVARNPENRTILLNNGIEKSIRTAKVNHVSCKEAATDALRDLGVDNYNS